MDLDSSFTIPVHDNVVRRDPLRASIAALIYVLVMVAVLAAPAVVIATWTVLL